MLVNVYFYWISFLKEILKRGYLMDQKDFIFFLTNHGRAVVVIIVGWFPWFQTPPTKAMVTFGTGHAKKEALERHGGRGVRRASYQNQTLITNA